jgi:hypothetical protein
MRKVKFNVGYSKYLLLTMKEAEQLTELLDGKSVCIETWIEDGRYAYLENDGYVCELEFTDGRTLYHTQEEYENAKKAEEERRDAA